MKKPLAFIASLFLITYAGFAQVEQGNVMINGGMDAYRTSNSNPFQAFKRIGGGLDINYFVADQLSLGFGWEIDAFINGAVANHWGFATRFYPFSTAFIRVKSQHTGFFKTNQLKAGIGYDIKLNHHWFVEANADYYIFTPSAFGFRLGITWFI